jgi:hypothetical protein
MTAPNKSPKAGGCPGCGMPREDWPKVAGAGYAKDGVVYCCEGCADGSGCTCRQYIVAGKLAPTAEELRADPASGEFIQSLRHQTDHIGAEDYGTDVTKGKPPPTGRND